MDYIKNTIELVTPKMAEEWIAGMGANRHLKESVVTWILEQMKASQWKLNGETIKFSNDGRLIDGQHRLNAVIRYGKPVLLEIRRGVDAKSIDTIDTGSRRKVSDVLDYAGEVNTALLAATLRMIFMHEHCLLLSNPNSAGFNSIDAQKYLQKNPNVRESVRYSQAARSNAIAKLIPTSTLAYTHYYMASFDADKSAVFWERVFGNDADGKTSPTRALRSWMINSKRTGRNVRNIESAAMIVKAWSAHVDGKQLSQVRWRRWGDTPESFPVWPGETESRGPAMRKGTRRPNKMERSAE